MHALTSIEGMQVATEKLDKKLKQQGATNSESLFWSCWKRRASSKVVNTICLLTLNATPALPLYSGDTVMGYYADTEKGATRTGIMSVLFIIEEVRDCWKVRFCGESETDLVQPPMMNMSKTSALLMTKTMVHQVGEVSSGPGPRPPMHQLFRLKYIGNKEALHSVGVAHRHTNAMHRISL